MYSYTWDPETGGLLLNSSPLQFSKEPRPVYSKELDILGFNKYWIYDKDDSTPLMWAEANNYIYRGKLVAQVKGGSLKEKPKVIITDDPEPDNRLRPVDIKTMVGKNASLMEAVVQLTIKRIYDSYRKYQKKADVFYVAFSGGKDSIVTLDVVQRTLPHNSFKVLFGDTGMEFPDTYTTVDYYENYCQEKNIDFIRSKSNYTPEYTWKRFGPPATVNRWCCSVHKTSPQIITLRKLLGKHNFTGFAFIGVRASESVARSDYDYISLGEKHKGQYSCNPIIEWNTAELYLYIYGQGLYLNSAYKKGNRRAGCLVCPRAAERSDYFARKCYSEAFDKLVSSIKYNYAENFNSEEKLNDFIENGGWKARKNGRDIAIKQNYSEFVVDSKCKIELVECRTDWKEWIKTIGVLVSDTTPYKVISHNKTYSFDVQETEKGLIVTIDEDIAKKDPTFIRLFKNVFKKAASCILCQVCQADCHNGSLHMEDGKLHIDENCLHCSQCHKVEKGCLLYKSTEKPKGQNNMKTQSLNCYSHHAPKMDWFTQFFKFKDNFDDNHTLGSNMYDFFKRFLRDAEILKGNDITTFAEKLFEIGLDNNITWALMFTNLSYSPQIGWYVKHIGFSEQYKKEYVLSMLVEDGAKESWAPDLWSSFTRISELPFSIVGFGSMMLDGKKAVGITRFNWIEPNPEVILYALYKFAEASEDYKQFSLNRISNGDTDGNGITPYQLFGTDKESLTAILNGLASRYPEYISVAFTHDLDNIKLSDDKTSADVLTLF